MSKSRLVESSGEIPVPPMGDGVAPGGGHGYPLTFSVDYPDRSLDRLSTAFRIFTVIPIAILAATLEGGGFGAGVGGNEAATWAEDRCPVHRGAVH